MYCWTGARLKALFEQGDLRYKDIYLVQRRRPDGKGYQCMWKVDQRWVKGNCRQHTVVYELQPTIAIIGMACREHGRLLYNDRAIFIPLAFVDKALFGFDTLYDLWQQEIPPGDNELLLRWTDFANNQPTCQLTLTKFERISRAALDNASYFCAASVHQIRRILGKKIDNCYTEVERSQHITRADPRISGRSHFAECSAVDGMSTFLNEEPDHSVNDYFQGLERFRERGLPTSLPAAEKDAIEKVPEIVELKKRVAAARNNFEYLQASKSHCTVLG